jgi:uncharacterized iron-regulated membrane protein
VNANDGSNIDSSASIPYFGHMTRLLFTLHKWLGLTTGIFLLAIGLSGSFLVYSHSLDRWFNPALYKLDPQGTRLSIDSMLSIVNRKAGHGFSSCSFDVPATDAEPVEFTLTKPQTSYHARDQVLVDLHPYTGKILREGSAGDISVSFVHWAMDFHDSLHAGRIGMLIVAIVSVTVFLSIITGLIYYGKHFRHVLLFRLPLNRSQFFRSLHMYVGVWAVIFNSVVCFTGFWMMKGTFSRDSWRLASPRPRAEIIVSIDSCLATSKRALPGFVPDFVSVPYYSGDLIEIDGNMENTPTITHGDACRVIIDPQSGKVVEAVDVSKASFPQNISQYVWPMHIGNYGGHWIKLLYVIGGLMPGILSLTGFMMWWRKKGEMDGLLRELLGSDTSNNKL